MSTKSLILLDHAVALLGAAAWLTAAVALALRRPRPALTALAAASLLTLSRGVSVALLAGRGWWFVQEKLLLGLPVLLAAGAVAVVLAAPRLLAASRGRDGDPSAAGVLAVFTTAYAALAGLGVTILAGYPLTPGTAAIMIAAVGTATLLTARALGPGREGTAERHGDARTVSRRRFIGWTGGAAVAAVAGAGIRDAFRPAETVVTGGGPGPTTGPAVSVADLRGSGSPAPGGAVRRHELTARKATVRLSSGREIDAWTFDGRIPGPPVVATEGDLVEVRLRNADIDDGVTLHWHGYDVPCGEDGVPGVTQHPVPPGGDFVYRFRADQVGTYWYHTHRVSYRGVRKGLYGTLVVTPRDAPPAAERVDLTLPLHTFDGTLVIGSADGRTTRVVPPGTAVRLRLINTDSDPHRIVLAGTPFRVAAVDGRDLDGPGEVAGVALDLAAGGRYDLTFDMPGGVVALVVDDAAEGGIRLLPHTGAAGDAPAADTSALPELDLLRYGTFAPRPFGTGDADRHFTMVLDRGVAVVDGAPAYAQTVNGRGHPHIPDQLVAEGDIVAFTVVNRSLETHPWHLHGHPVLILSRDGVPSTGGPLWMDSFNVRPGEVWEVAFRADNPGIWMNHCHNLPHAHRGMMLRLRYDGVTTPFGTTPGHVHRPESRRDR